MRIERVKMPRSASGRPVPDKFMCDVGHLHPSHGHALKCNVRRRKAAEARAAARAAKAGR